MTRRLRGLQTMWLSAWGPPTSRGAGNSCSRGVFLIHRLNGRGYTASFHVASAFITSSQRWVRGRTRPWAGAYGGSSPFHPAAAQIDQLHVAASATSSPFSAAAVTARTDCGRAREILKVY